MSEEPEIPPPPPIDPAGGPTDYSGHYYRPTDTPHGSADKLQALADGYFGLNWVFLINVVFVIVARVVSTGTADPDEGVLVLLGAAGVLFFLVAVLTFPHNRKIASGMGWPESGAYLASFLMGLNSALCCGIIGYIVMQMIAANEMKRYGLKAGLFGIKKKDVRARVEELRNAPKTPGMQI